MISTSPFHPSQPETLGELRALTAHLPDSTRLTIDDSYGDYPAPACYQEEDGSVCFTEPFAAT